MSSENPSRASTTDTSDGVSCDVLVVGGGPAGASAAKKAAEHNRRVILIDKASAEGKPVQCAEFIPLAMLPYAYRTRSTVQRIAGMKTRLPSGATESSEFPGLMLDRHAFDQRLLDEARALGAVIYPGTRLERLAPQRHEATLGGDGAPAERVHYRTLVAADGPHSTVGRQLGLPDLAVVVSRQYTVPLQKPYSDTDIWLSDAYPGGYAWLFPKGQVANLGVGIDRRFCRDLKAPLDELHRHLVANGFVGERIIGQTGGPIPVSGLRSPLAYRDVVFVGDAGGLTHPITGAGIAPAVVTGEMAGEAVTAFLDGDSGALDEYADDVYDLYAESLERAVERRAELESIWHTPEANEDAVLRRGWIAFTEYFALSG